MRRRSGYAKRRKVKSKKTVHGLIKTFHGLTRIGRYRKKRSGMGLRKSVRLGPLVPDKLYTKLRYSKTNFLLTQVPPGSRSSISTLLANTLHQPENGGTVGHQYLLHDTWKQLYSQYRVLASKIEVWVHNASGSAPTAGIVSLCAKKESTIASISLDEGHTLEDPRWKTRIVNTTASKGLYMKAFQKTKNVLGYTGSNFPYEAYSAFDTSPAEGWYWHVGATDFAAGVTNLQVIVRLTAYCEFSHRANLPLADAAT